MNPPPDPELSTLLFPSASRSISSFAREIGRAKLSLRSRLASIASDADFVAKVHESAGGALPLVANERCGSWYVAPALKRGSAYFKSTDGHFGQWAFSRRRLNVHLLPFVAEHGGCIIVDSTRRGKSIPDALSKTVPIWAEVWNRLLFPESKGYRTSLETPSQAVSESENHQIATRLDEWVADLAALDVDTTRHIPRLDLPMRPISVTHASLHQLPDLLREVTDRGECYPLILCTASGQDAVQAGAMLPPGCEYVQGAADDAETWAYGLTPDLFWANREELLACDEDGLPGLIARLVGAAGGAAAGDRAAVRISPTPTVWIGTACNGTEEEWDLVVDLRPDAKPDAEPDKAKQKTIALPLEPGKLGSRALRKVLPALLEGVEAKLAADSETKILVTCTTGKDLSIGVALAILCLYASEDGTIGSTRRKDGINKDFIRKRLGWIMVCIPDANPSRATLQSVNAVLLG